MLSTVFALNETIELHGRERVKIYSYDRNTGRFTPNSWQYRPTCVKLAVEGERVTATIPFRWHDIAGNGRVKKDQMVLVLSAAAEGSTTGDICFEGEDHQHLYIGPWGDNWNVVRLRCAGDQGSTVVDIELDEQSVIELESLAEAVYGF